MGQEAKLAVDREIPDIRPQIQYISGPTLCTSPKGGLIRKRKEGSLKIDGQRGYTILDRQKPDIQPHMHFVSGPTLVRVPRED